jgi:hypothetical protein
VDSKNNNFQISHLIELKLRRYSNNMKRCNIWFDAFSWSSNSLVGFYVNYVALNQKDNTVHDLQPPKHDKLNFMICHTLLVHKWNSWTIPDPAIKKKKKEAAIGIS